MGQEASGKGESPSVVGGVASGNDRHLGGFILPKSRAKRPHAELGFQFSILRFCPCQNQKTVRLMTTFSPPTPSILIQQWFSSTGGVLPQGAVATSGTPVVDTPAGVALPGPKPGGCSQGPGRQGWRGRDCWLVSRSPAGRPPPRGRPAGGRPCAQTLSLGPERFACVFFMHLLERRHVDIPHPLFGLFPWSYFPAKGDFF